MMFRNSATESEGAQGGADACSDSLGDKLARIAIRVSFHGRPVGSISVSNYQCGSGSWRQCGIAVARSRLQ